MDPGAGLPHIKCRKKEDKCILGRSLNAFRTSRSLKTLGCCGPVKCISGPGKLEMHFWKLPKCTSGAWGAFSSRYGPLKISLPLQPLLWSSKSLLRLLKSLSWPVALVCRPSVPADGVFTFIMAPYYLCM